MSFSTQHYRPGSVVYTSSASGDFVVPGSYGSIPSATRAPAWGADLAVVATPHGPVAAFDTPAWSSLASPMPRSPEQFAARPLHGYSGPTSWLTSARDAFNDAYDAVVGRDPAAEAAAAQASQAAAAQAAELNAMQERYKRTPTPEPVGLTPLAIGAAVGVGALVLALSKRRRR